ncbi:MAG TPA: aldehyde dehydrogenase family protein [Aliidongia sp.]|uniref:aldehyde dehydrogenase family protein n=1 Tax=Aliidongia sp. TaxID=1914230 RepID=UPI002DDD32A3|nr:aldehyde dehydrogenase family protein [Aliidongia sp.]HEV2673794.1 aldehyde dehydrogenase family protein [Aliidongia sp.]
MIEANRTGLLIDGVWREASGGTIPVIDPSDGQIKGQIGRATKEDVDLAVQAARRSLKGDWGNLAAVDRGRLLTRLGTAVLDHFDQLAAAEALDTGKPTRQARADITALARYFEFYGGAADKVHGETLPYLRGYTVMTLREPFGVTGHIIPWNYPVQIFGRSVAAALAMGNAAVVKPAEEASLTALIIGQLALDVGFPPGALNIVPGYGEEAGAALTGHPDIDHISFTGSPEVGTLVQQAAARHHRPVTLELGGKSAQLVFDDADLAAALPVVVSAIIQNAGQTCSAGSRVLVQDGIYDRFVGALADRFAILQVGSSAQDLDVGPVINPKQQQRVDAYIERARADGLQILAQGRISPGAPAGGFYVKPTLIGDVPPDHALAQEEVFGPVLTVIRFRDEADALRIANGTPYGLVAGAWTRDGGRQLRLARALEAGQVFINNYGAGGGVELPFGGVKHSGHGREKGFEALFHFSTIKTVAIRHE